MIQNTSGIGHQNSPACSGVSEQVSERASEKACQRAVEKAVEWARQVSEWPVINIPISKGSESLWITVINFEIQLTHFQFKRYVINLFARRTMNRKPIEESKQSEQAEWASRVSKQSEQAKWASRVSKQSEQAVSNKIEQSKWAVEVSHDPMFWLFLRLLAFAASMDLYGNFWRVRERLSN